MQDPILEYIEKELKKGFSKKEVFEKLVHVGYKPERISTVLKDIPVQLKPEEDHHTKFEVMVAVIVLLILITGLALHFVAPPTDSTEVTTQQIIKEETTKSKYTYDSETGKYESEGLAFDPITNTFQSK